MGDFVKLDAEYMNRWLGDNAQIETLSPKTLFDIQTLIEYYRDIIVPGTPLSIRFPTAKTDIGPRASVERGEVIIPFHMLTKGGVDQTIGSMIHELHHIKWSASERFTAALIFKVIRRMMEQIQCGGMTMAERVFSDSSLIMEHIIGDEESGEPAILFLRKVIGDLLFLVNAVEDVRIDANTPPNLRKYIDKIDAEAGGKLKDAILGGSISDDERSITAIAFMCLAHHKDIHHFPFIEKRYGDRDAIVNGDPTKYPLDLFTAFKEEITSHILNEYYKHCGVPNTDPSGQVGGSACDEGDFDLDAYFGGKVNEGVSGALDEQFSTKANAPCEAGKTDAENKALEEADKALVSMDVSPKEHSAPWTAADARIDLSSKEDVVRNWDDESQDGAAPANAEEFRNMIAQENEPVFLDSTLEAQIKSFKNVRVITTTEHFDDNKVVYDSVLFDTVN